MDAQSTPPTLATAPEGTSPRARRDGRPYDPVVEVNVYWLFDTAARLMGTCHKLPVPGGPPHWWIDPEGAIPREMLARWVREPEITEENAWAVAMWARRCMSDLAMGVIGPEDLDYEMTVREREVYEQWYRILRSPVVPLSQPEVIT